MRSPLRAARLLKIVAVTLWVTTVMNVAVVCRHAGLFSIDSDSSSVASRMTVEPCCADSSTPTSDAISCSEAGVTATGVTCEAPQENVEGALRPGEAWVALKEVARRLDEAQLAREQQELALKLVDSGQGVFRGFGRFAAGVRSPVERFQERIVELEIEKQGLLVKFSPQSPEVRSLETEISGVRGAMRQCLLGSLTFLERDIEALSARKAELTGAVGKAGPKASANKSRRLNRPSGAIGEASPLEPRVKGVVDQDAAQSPGVRDEDQGFFGAATSPGLRRLGWDDPFEGVLFHGADLTRNVVGHGPWSSPMFVQTTNLFDGRTPRVREGRKRLQKPAIQLPEFTALTMRSGK